MANQFPIQNTFASSYHSGDRTPGGCITRFDRRVHTVAADGTGDYPSNFSIADRMQHGTIPAGERVGSDARWERDVLPECHNDDTLWGYAIRNSDVLHQERESVNDPVLFNLLRMGIYDWRGVNTLQNQAIQAVRWSSATIMRVLQRVFKLEKQFDHWEADIRQVINSQTTVVNNCVEKVDELDCTSNAIGAGLNLAVSRIDADLKELDERVTRRRQECKSNEIVIDLCQGRINELERIIEAQAQAIARLKERMEEVACKKSNRPGPVFDPEESSDSSYVTPPLAAHSPSIIALRSVTPLQLVEEDQDVPMRPPGIGWSLTQEALGEKDEDLVFHSGMAMIAKNVLNHLGANPPSGSDTTKLEKMLEGVVERNQQYEEMHHISELVGASECNYHFHPHTVMNGDVLISMSVESDGRWVDHMVTNVVPRFRFWGSSDDADLMGEDRNDIIDPEYNNAE